MSSWEDLNKWTFSINTIGRDNKIREYPLKVKDRKE
jgi:hypothetical protein